MNSNTAENPYETDELVSQYLGFHYGRAHFGVENYPARCAALCLEALRLEAMAGTKTERALDLGCAVGRSTFELARAFNQVVGLDLSGRFIECANALKDQGRLDYKLPDEGELGSLHQASLTEFGLDTVADRVAFFQEDACHLDARHRDYDLIFAGNLIDRLRSPREFLANLHRHLRVGGTLVVSSPYTLLTDYTPRENWIGGFRRGDRDITVLDGMKECLAPHFDLVGEPRDVPFVIRETRRKFQHTLAEMSVWRRVR